MSSPTDANVTIFYKAPPVGTCTTVFASQQQYLGYVRLPPQTLAPIWQNYTINTFFWFFEARESPESAPLTIYINGGPGSSSMVGLFQETGPCAAIEIAKDLFGTQAREWGWDRSTNILFVDQPNQVGLSFDTPTNISLNLLNGVYTNPPIPAPSGQPSYTFLNGTSSSLNAHFTTNTSAIAAQAIWHMLQAFLAAFPQYNPGTRPNATSSGIVSVNLFAESYGGKYGPTFAAFWESQNDRRRNGSLPLNTTLEIQLQSLGIMQGCVDDLVQGSFYPKFAYNNTYGIQAISLADQLTTANAFLSADGCQQQILECRAAVTSQDPLNNGDEPSVDKICSDAVSWCATNVVGPYTSSGRSVYDITQNSQDPFPPLTYLEYLNTASFQVAVGTPVNYTETSAAASDAFELTGDYDRGAQVAQLADLVSRGVRVALIYGDRDYICNWLGGEAVSFAVAGAALPQYAGFYSAGYAQIVTNSTYIGGVVRQFGNLSFSRIYDAGHLIPAYQPETAFEVFTRVIMGTSISTGAAVDLSTFITNGDGNATYVNTPPPSQSPVCYLRAVPSTCSNDQKILLQQGGGVIINGVLYDKESDWTPPASTVSQQAGVPGTAPTSMLASSVTYGSGPRPTSALPTGVYVATGTPTRAATTTKKKSGEAHAKPRSVAVLPFSVLALISHLLIP